MDRLIVGKLCERSIDKSTNRSYDEQVEIPVAGIHIKELVFNSTNVSFGKFLEGAMYHIMQRHGFPTKRRDAMSQKIARSVLFSLGIKPFLL